jgi:hypothetical protein
MVINEQDAFSVFQKLEQMPEDMRPRAASFLADYRGQQEREGLPLWPTQEKAKIERRAKVADIFADPLKLDAEDGSYVEAERVSPGLGDKLRKREANILFLADRYGADEADVRNRLDFYRADASEKWGGVALDDGAFFAKAKGEIDQETKQREAVKMSTLTGIESALWGEDGFSELSRFQASKPDATPEEQDAFSGAYRAFNDVLAPRRDLVTRATEAMRRIQQGEDSEQDQSTMEELTWTMVNATGKEREILKRAVVLGAQKVAQEGGKRDAGATFTGSAANLIDAMFGSRRRGESLVTKLDPSSPLPVGPVASVEDALKAMNLMVQAQVSASRPYDPNAPTLPEPRQLSEDEQKLFTEAKAKAKELFKVDRELKKIALSTDPMDDSFLGTMASGTASSLAMALPLALGPGGVVLAAGGYANMETEELLTEFPEMNPADAAQIAVLSGGTQALLDKAQLAGLGRFAPNIRKMLTEGATKELVKRAVIEGGGTFAFENIVEAAQDLTTPVVQQLVSDLSASVPGVDWEKENREFWGSRLDIAIGMMPLTLLGVGANTAMNKATALDLMANDRALAAAGVIETDRTTVLELARDGKAEEAQAALVDAWERRSPELAAEMGSEQEAGIIQAQNAIQRAEESGLLPKLRRDGSGWAVEDSETGAVVRVSNREEAVARVFGHLDEQEQRRAQAGAQLWDEIYDGGAEALKAEAGEMTTARLAGRSRQDAEWVRQGVQTFGELHGLTPDEAIQAAGAVLGFNRDETNEGVRSAVSSVFGRGMNVATVLHEATHGRWRAGLESGRFTHEQGVAWVRMAEQATGLDFLPSKVDAEISAQVLDEAIIDVTVSDAIGRRKAGGRFSAGLISRGMAAMARGERAEAKQAGKLATWLKAWRDFWGVVLSKGRALNKARKEGKISNEFDAFLDDLMETSPQARHESGAAREAMEMVEVENMPFSLAPAFNFDNGDAALKTAFSEFAGRALSESQFDGTFVYRAVTDEEVAEISRLGGPDVSGMSHEFDAAHLRHALKAHSDNDSEAKRGQRAMTEADLPRFIQTLDQPDKITVKRGKTNNTKVNYQKLFPDGTVMVAERIIETSNKKTPRLSFRTAWVSVSAAGVESNTAQVYTPGRQGQDAQSNGESQGSFSLAPRSLASVADTVLASQMRKPEFREGFLTAARQRLSKLRDDGEWRVDKRGIASRKIGVDTRMDGIRSPASIENERKFRLRSRQRELIDAGMMQLAPETIMAYDQGVTALEDNPLISSMLNDHGKLMSKTTALRLGKLKTDGVGNAGDYDDAPRLPIKWYAKTDGIMPDVMATELGFDSVPRFWDALRSAIYSAQTANEGFKKARDAVRKVEADALAQARQESDQWAKDEIARIPSEKERQMMALRTLDAILSAFPPEVRGMVGGFVKLASLGTDKAREAEIIRRLNLLDEVVEKAAKKHYGERIEKLFKKAAPKREAGKKPTGKLGPQAQALFDLAEKFSELNEAGVAAERTAIAEAMAANERNATKLADLFEREQLLDLFGAVYERTSAEMEAAAEWLAETYADGRNKWRAVIEARMEEVKAGRKAAKDDTGKAGTDAETQAVLEQAKTIGSKLKSLGPSFLSFEQVINAALGRGSVMGRGFVRQARKATNLKTDALRVKRDQFRDTMAGIFGAQKQLEWRARIFELSQLSDPSAITVTKMEGQGIETKEIPAEIIERILNGQADAKAYGLDTLTVEALADAWADNEALPGNRRKDNLSYDVPTLGKPTPTKLSQLQAVHVTMMARQAGYAANMAGHGWDTEALEDIETKLTPEAKAIRDFLAEEYRTGYDSLNAVYSRMYGLNLPRITNYAPGTFEAMDAMGQDVDPYGQGLLAEGGIKAGMLKTRKKHQAKPRLDDALSVYWGHVNATEHFKSFGEFARDIRSVLNFADVRGSISAKGGASLLESLQSWITAFERNGLEQGKGIAAFNELARKRQSAQSWVALAYNVGTLMKQSTAALGSLMNMGPMDATRQFSKLLTGRLELSASYNSEVIQRRLDAGYSPEVRQAMAGAMAEKPTWGSPIVQKGMEIIGMVDAMFTTASHAMAYDYHLNEAKAAGLTDAQAKRQAETEAEATVARTAQPVEMMDRSLVEVGMAPFAKFLFMFASDARQKAALAWEAYSPNSDLTKGERATRLLMLHVLLPVMVQTISNLWRDARDDGEDDELFDERNWQAGDYVRAMLVGPLVGVPLVSQALNSFSSQSPLTQFTGGLSGIGEAFEEGDIDKGMKAVKTLLRTSAVVAGGERAAAVAVGAGSLFDAYRVLENLTSDE